MCPISLAPLHALLLLNLVPTSVANDPSAILVDGGGCDTAYSLFDQNCHTSTDDGEEQCHTTDTCQKLREMYRMRECCEVEITVPYSLPIETSHGQVWDMVVAESTFPDQCWLAVGSDPNGQIYASGHDHVSNSLLYRVFPDETLRYIGDAKSAAIEWNPGETAEKFHTRPTFFDGVVYVATMDKSNIGATGEHPFRWYGYNVGSGVFYDLGPTGSYESVVTLQIDQTNRTLYGMTVTNKLMRHELGSELTTNVGRPLEWTSTAYACRFMWIDRKGRVYVTAGSKRNQWKAGTQESMSTVYRYLPETNEFESVDGWNLVGNAIEVGQWERTRTRCYVSDDIGNIYVFTDSETAPTWKYLGSASSHIVHGAEYKTWVFQVTADEKKIYVGLSDSVGDYNNHIVRLSVSHDADSCGMCASSSITEDETTRSSWDLYGISDEQFRFITGYDSWDDQGRFYVSSFKMYDGEAVKLVAINPATAWNPEPPPTVNVSVVNDEIVIARSGPVDSTLTVLYEWIQSSDWRSIRTSPFESVVFGVDQATHSVSPPSSTSTHFYEMRVIPDGHSYVVERDNFRIGLV